MAKIFVSYAHEDSGHMETLRKNCGALRELHELEWFDDTQIRTGELWKPHILQKLHEADGIVLLLSHHFVGSEFCVGVELPEAKRRAESGEATLVPVLVETIFWKSLKIEMYSLLPKDGNNDLKPVKDWRDRQKAWVQVVEVLYALGEGES